MFIINQEMEIVNKLENGHMVKSLMHENEIDDQTVRDIFKKKQILIKFAGTLYSKKGMYHRKQ